MTQRLPHPFLHSSLFSAEEVDVLKQLSNGTLRMIQAAVRVTRDGGVGLDATHVNS